jgi:hypothetical protein
MDLKGTVSKRTGSQHLRPEGAVRFNERQSEAGKWPRKRTAKLHRSQLLPLREILRKDGSQILLARASLHWPSTSCVGFETARLSFTAKLRQVSQKLTFLPSGLAASDVSRWHRFSGLLPVASFAIRNPAQFHLRARSRTGHLPQSVGCVCSGAFLGPFAPVQAARLHSAVPACA